MLKVISEWYLDRDYVTSRAYVTAQDLATGSLLITVIEGVIETIELDDPDSRINTNTDNASKLSRNSLISRP